MTESYGDEVADNLVGRVEVKHLLRGSGVRDVKSLLPIPTYA